MEQAAAGGRRRGGAGRFWIGPVAGIAALAVLAGSYALLVRPKPQTAPHYLVGATATAIHSLTFRAHHKTLTLYQQPSTKSAAAGTTWTIGRPGGTAADQTLAQGFVSALVTLTASRTLAAKPTAAQLRGWGLAPAHASVTVATTTGKPVVLAVGQATPVGGYYARLNGSGPAYLIHGMVPAEISADPKAWLPQPASSSSAATPSSTSASIPHVPASSSTPPATAKGAATTGATAAKSTTSAKKAG